MQLLTIVLATRALVAQTDSDLQSCREKAKREFMFSTQCYEEVIKSQPGNLTAHYEVAILYINDDSVWQALPHLAFVVAQDPANSDATKLLGAVHLKTKNYGDAVKTLERAAKLNDKDAETYNLLGNAYMYTKNVEKALASFRVAFGLDGRSASIATNLGFVEYLLHDKASAKTHFLQASELDPTYIPVDLGLGLISADEGRYKVAIDLVEIYIQRESYSEIAAYQDKGGRWHFPILTSPSLGSDDHEGLQKAKALVSEWRARLAATKKKRHND